MRTITSLALTLLVIGSYACGGSSPVAPAPVPAPVPTPTPVPTPVQFIRTAACPSMVTGVDLAFYQMIGCNLFDGPPQPVRRWLQAPRLYLRTVDDAGSPIDALTLDTVQHAMEDEAPKLTAGMGLAGVERGSDTREGQTGWITVRWDATADRAPACGHSEVATDGGWIYLHPKVTTCACGGSAIRPRTARHELGHAMGYWHTDSANDLMAGVVTPGCDAGLSAREQQAVAVQYER